MINLVNFDAKGMFQPSKNLRNMTEQDLLDSGKYPNEKIGVFGEFSVPVKVLNASLTYWQTIGFEPLSLNEQPYPWAILSDGTNIVGLHQTKEFNNLAITYFAPDMKRRIEILKNEGLEENIKGFNDSHESDQNAVLSTMEGQKFFLFSF